MTFKRVCFDLEANNLLHPMLDFSSMPYKLNDEAELYCLTLRDMDTDDNVLLLPEKYLHLEAPVKIVEYYQVINVTDVPTKLVSHYERYKKNGELFSTEKTKHFTDDPNITLSSMEYLDEEGIEYNNLNKDLLTKEKVKQYFSQAEEIIGHNILNYDLPVLQLFGIFDYKIGYPGKSSFLFGREVQVTDTLLISKIYNPDRMDQFGKHSLKAFGMRTGSMKGDYTDFSHYNYRMGVYCNQDGVVTKQTYRYLDQEENFEEFRLAYSMEAKIADQQVRQEAFGFHFDLELAESSIIELTELLKNCKEKVEPHLPPKKLNKGEQSLYTPPKIQFKKNGELAAAIRKFTDKIGASLVEKPNKEDPDTMDYFLQFNGIDYKLPFHDPVLTSLPTSLKDGNVVKEYLIELGWVPSEWNIRDLTKDSKKAKCDHDKILANINRYVEETDIKGLFKASRYEELDLDPAKHDLKSYLLDKYMSKPNSALKVSTTPPLRVGADKSLCPNLIRLSEKMGENSYIQFIVDFHTYTHRKNSIAGGDMDEDGNPSKGFISFLREDGRVATPADTLGAACVVESTIVTTKSGIKPILQVKKGEKVLTHLQRYMTVTDIIINGIKPVYEVTTASNHTITCTENHRFWCNSGQWIQAQNLTTNDILHVYENDICTTSKLTSVQYIGTQPTFDLTVETDHSYVANNIVTHNTGRYLHRNIKLITGVLKLL